MRPRCRDRVPGMRGLSPDHLVRLARCHRCDSVMVADARLVGVRTPLGIVMLVAACARYVLVRRLNTGRWWSWGPLDAHRKV